MKRDVMADGDEGRGRAGGLSEDIQVKIGHQLKSIYDGILDEPVPDRLAGLLEQLERADAKGRDRGNE